MVFLGADGYVSDGCDSGSACAEERATVCSPVLVRRPGNIIETFLPNLAASLSAPRAEPSGAEDRNLAIAFFHRPLTLWTGLESAGTKDRSLVTSLSPL